MPSKTELSIAGFYDGIYLFYGLANSLLTFGLDRWWRLRAARLARAAAPAPGAVLDVCCGTGDFSLALKKAYGQGLALAGADLSAPMLSLAGKKLPGAEFTLAEAKELPFPDGKFGLVTISFATRNLNTGRVALLAALREFRRVLAPGGVFLQVETTRPANPLVWALMRLYVTSAIGLLNLLSPKSRSSYLFLRNTILNWYAAPEFDALLLEAGFSRISHKILCPGAVAVHLAIK